MGTQINSPKQQIRIASRKSDLARIQAYTVGNALKTLLPTVQIEYQFRESLGDKNLNDPLWKIPEKGVFTQDFHQDLVLDQTDLVVHSWKDLAVEENPDTFVACTFQREDVRDVLFVKKSHFSQIEKTGRLRIYTSSPRRMFHFTAFAKTYLPFQIQHCEYESVRGNIQTRMRKMLEADEIDGILMAKAGLDRMLSAPQPEFHETQEFFKTSLQKLNFMVLPISTNPQAPAQGALALEVKRTRQDLIQILEKLNHQQTFQDVVREREILKSYGGGCHSKIGVSSFSCENFQLILANGEIDSKEIQRNDFISPHVSLYQKQFHPNELCTLQSSDYFHLEHFPRDQVLDRLKQAQSQTQKSLVLEIAKESYLNDLPLPQNSFLWASGLETWKKLALKKIWVHGSQESFGSLISRPSVLFGKQVQWCKLTHDMAANYPGYQSGLSKDIHSIPTCRLLDKSNIPDLSASQAFFWKSGSLFLKAVADQPEILNKVHFCGLGETFQIISEYFHRHQKTKSVYPFPSEKTWRDYVTKI